MSDERRNNEQMTQVILSRVVKDGLKELPAKQMSYIPEPEHLDPQDEVVANQIGDLIAIVGDEIVKKYDKKLNDILDGPVWTQSMFQKLVGKVFADRVVNWGRIAMLIFTVGKIALKTVRNSKVSDIPGAVADIFSWTLSYFKENLLGWILKMGGWICSIAEIASNCMEIHPPKPTTDRALAISYFVSGIILGGFVVFWFTVK